MNAVVRGANLFASNPTSRRKPTLPSSKLTVLMCVLFFLLCCNRLFRITVQYVEKTDSQSVPETTHVHRGTARDLNKEMVTVLKKSDRIKS
jgi:hypothetical protein